MSGKTSLKLSSRTPNVQLTPEQERFKFLIAQIEKVRKDRADGEASILRFRNEYAARMQPLRATLTTVCRDTVFAVDRLLDLPGWSRTERESLQNILRGTAEALLEANSADLELKAMFDKHSPTSYDAAKQEELQRLKEQAEELTGLDLGEETGIHTEEDLVQRMYEEMSAREAASESARSQQQRESVAQKRIDANAQITKSSLREIYRKLASAVHPDREHDPQRRAEKNALMQKINQAYAANDLLALFEAQLEIGAIDAERISAFSAQRLKQYNKLLAQQLAAARSAIRDMENGFRVDYGLDPDHGVTPQKFNQVIQGQARGIRAEIARQKQFLLVLKEKASAKRWLKEQRRFARALDDLDDE